ncbi:MAG: hypothetical protein ACLUTF_09720 [Anaerostipes hadrus]
MRGYTEHDEHMEEIAQESKTVHIRSLKEKATYYGVAMAGQKNLRAIIRDENLYYQYLHPI